jgi:isocitrate dehydrogenase
MTHDEASTTPSAAAPVVTVARGDGIGPEIMEATLAILDAAGARLTYDEIEVGEKVFQRGFTSGIEPASWEKLRHNKLFLKAPITTPQGGGYKSLNVTIRKTLGLFANVRPCVSYDPVVNTRYPGTDIAIIRENEEDTYAGIEHRQTQEVVQTLKLITRPGSERIIRYAFEYARMHARKKVSCMSKDNIMKLTDGLFHRMFDEIGAQYPDIERDHWIVDIGMARMANHPTQFDVIVTENLYGDILSDIAAELTGSVGLGGSANIGNGFAMFEAIHGSAPTIAGQGIANPSGLLLAAVMMLVHVGQRDVATRIHNGWLRTLEEGIHTGDIFTDGESRQRVGTREFATAVIKRLGMAPSRLAAVDYTRATGEVSATIPILDRPYEAKQLVGVDLFLDWDEAGRDATVLGHKLEALDQAGLKLKMITNRGVKVYPDGFPETFHTDHWRCRFVSAKQVYGPVSHGQIIGILRACNEAGLDVIKTENLYTFDGQIGFSLGQGE